MIRRDMDEVLDIERLSFGHPWTLEDYEGVLRKRNCVGMIVEIEERVVGLMVYDLYPNRIRIMNFAVHPDFRRRGAGAMMLDKLKHRLSAQRRSRIQVEVSEENVSAQTWFSHRGFRAIAILRDHYEEHPGIDAYQFQFVHQPALPSGAEVWDRVLSE